MTGDTRGSDYVLRQVRESGVKFIGLWFTDVAGRLKSVSITDQQLETVLESGSAFDGGTMIGGARRAEQDLLLLPDPSTFAILPWRSGDQVGRMYCELVGADGSACANDPRTVLRRVLARAAERGWSFYVGCEVESYYFRGDGLPLQVLDRGSYFDATPSDDVSDLRRETVEALEQLGIAVESTHHEVGPGQYEVKLEYADPLSMADALMTYRQTAKQLALRYGMTASFMPKPLPGENGSGLHLTLSLLSSGQDAFGDADDPMGLSPTARSFVAGLLKHAPGLALVTNPNVNSYKRLIPGYEAPTRCSWARSAWDDLVRVPGTTAEHGGARFVELRSADPSCNPYLAFAAVLSAGLDGVSAGLEPPPPSEPDAPAEARALPTTLIDAATEAERSALLPDALGPELVATLVDLGRREWRAYHDHVSSWELERYFPEM